jgi:selenocysteine lyase/cysteine desulfurase
MDGLEACIRICVCQYDTKAEIARFLTAMEEADAESRG